MQNLNKFPKNLFLFVIPAIMLISCSTPQKQMLPGKAKDGSILLPNRYSLTPAGEHIPVGDLPLGMALSPDGKILAVTNNGNSEQFVSIIDVGRRKQIQTLPVRASFFGIDFSADGQRLFVSGGFNNLIYIFQRHDMTFAPADSILLTAQKSEWFVTGLAAAHNGALLYAATKTKKTLFKLDVAGKSIVAERSFDHFLYDVILTPDEKKVYVSLWGGGAVAALDAESLSVLKMINTGDHPNKMAIASGRLYVANANTDEVTVIDMDSDTVVESISVKPWPDAPNGSTPNGLALAPDGKRLYVANATNNCLAVFDIAEPGQSKLLGYIPTGWYPTAVLVEEHSNQLFIANGKGLISKANPNGPDPTGERNWDRSHYIGRMLWGTVSVLKAPEPAALQKHTKQVRKNNFWDKQNKAQNSDLQAHAVPRNVGDPSPIKYVVYIIKENRTYDQIFGDLAQGNGDSSLALFDRSVTPNHHKIVEQFTLFDNFYVDAEVSADGHEWSMGAIATDFIEKTWPSVYSNRGEGYPSEGNFAIASPTIGYLWDMAARQGLSYRSYAEFVGTPADSSEPAFAKVENLQGHFDPRFRPWDLDYMDIWRAREFIRELHEFEQNGDMPNLIIMRLPNDHTYGTQAGKHTPRSMVADNDLALGRVIDALSHSRFWKETAVFVLEDDAQNGPDHVDAHRSVLLAASPFLKRGFVDHNMYDTVSVLKTMELILGLPPMSQFDAAAFPLIPAFTDEPDFTPYDHLPNSYPLDNINTRTAYGADVSAQMDFSDEDEAPEQALNLVLWKSIKGVDSPMPAINNLRYQQLF